MFKKLNIKIHKTALELGQDYLSPKQKRAIMETGKLEYVLFEDE
jgi:hypothetical protein